MQNNTVEIVYTWSDQHKPEVMYRAPICSFEAKKLIQQVKDLKKPHRYSIRYSLDP